MITVRPVAVTVWRPFPYHVLSVQGRLASLGVSSAGIQAESDGDAAARVFGVIRTKREGRRRASGRQHPNQ
jgi:hypothetical protein